MSPIMKCVLVTGGAGYIGSHTCKALAAAGYVPVTFDNLESGHRELVKWGPLIEGDLRNPDSIAQAVRESRPIAVLHFAALAYVGDSVREPARYYRNNVLGTLNLLDAMIAHGVKNLVFSSTCATYGNPREMPIREVHPQNPVNPYGASKLMVERILQDYRLAYGMKSTSLRYFNAAGADDAGDSGELHDPETHLIPLAFDALLGKRDRLTVNGDDYDTPDGTCVRDYIHVTDLARAHVDALKYCMLNDDKASVFNLGTGDGYSVREVLRAIETVTGSAVPHLVGPRRAGDPSHLVADASAARAELGWTPHHSSLREIIESAWRWHQRDRRLNTTNDR
jgi:UDP-arabinose 4-epimerase